MPIQITIADLVGPAAALVGAIVIIWALWRTHVQGDADVRAQRDANGARADKAHEIAAGQVTATNRIADLWERDRDRGRGA